MPTTRSSSTAAPSTSVSALVTSLKSQLTTSQSTTIYVPLEDGDTPSDDELHALLAEGIHAEIDVVRNALSARAATEDEIDAAKGEATATSSASSSTPASSSA